MKVKELIEQLQSLDPELEVFIPGYEGGYESVSDKISEPQDFILNWYADWYYGPHELFRNVDAYDIELQENQKIVKGIVL